MIRVLQYPRDVNQQSKWIKPINTKNTSLSSFLNTVDWFIERGERIPSALLNQSTYPINTTSITLETWAPTRRWMHEYQDVETDGNTLSVYRRGGIPSLSSVLEARTTWKLKNGLSKSNRNKTQNKRSNCRCRVCRAVYPLHFILYDHPLRMDRMRLHGQDWWSQSIAPPAQLQEEVLVTVVAHSAAKIPTTTNHYQLPIHLLWIISQISMIIKECPVSSHGPVLCTIAIGFGFIASSAIRRGAGRWYTRSQPLYMTQSNHTVFDSKIDDMVYSWMAGA